MKWGDLYLLAQYDGIIISLTQHSKNRCIENQSGVTAFLPLKPLGLKELLTQSFANWHKLIWWEEKTKYNEISNFHRRLTNINTF